MRSEGHLGCLVTSCNKSMLHLREGVSLELRDNPQETGRCDAATDVVRGALKTMIEKIHVHVLSRRVRSRSYEKVGWSSEVASESIVSTEYSKATIANQDGDQCSG
jgi:hypothetical protein